MAQKYYAVKNGRKPGIYKSWSDCKAQVDGFSGATYKSFLKEEDAIAFLGGMAGGVKQTNGNSANKNAQLAELSSAVDITDVLDEYVEGVAVAYVDGSYDNAKKQFSYGAVVAYEQEEHHFSEKVEDESLVSMRNVAGEIKGAECAMRFAIEHGCKILYIYHDYEGIAKWCLGEWKTNKEGTKKYKAFYDSIQDQLEIKFVKVKGHSNDKYNDLADMLAKKALGIIM